MKTRNIFIDYLRGLCILMMILVHFSSFFPFPLKPLLSVGIDAVAEGFIFLAGMMIGMHYLKKYISEPKIVSKKIIKRAFEILIKNILMIYTIWLPFGYFLEPNKFQSLNDYLIFSFKVIILQEQPFALDILTIFAFLFIISPLILFLLKRNLNWLVISLSIIIFIFGLFKPYFLSIKPEETFPLALWQIYFVGGVFFGKFYKESNSIYGKININSIVAILFIFLNLLIRHFPAILGQLLHSDFFASIQYEKFPLNLPGFIYGLSVIYFIYEISKILWPMLSKFWLFNEFLKIYGMNSLRAFILHVYFDYFIKIIIKFAQPPDYLVYLMILFDIAIIYLILKYWGKIVLALKIKE